MRLKSISICTQRNEKWVQRRHREEEKKKTARAHRKFLLLRRLPHKFSNRSCLLDVECRMCRTVVFHRMRFGAVDVCVCVVLHCFSAQQTTTTEKIKFYSCDVDAEEKEKR